AEGVVLQAGVLSCWAEAVLEQLLHQRLGVRQRDQAVPDIAGREHVEVAPESAAAAAVVGYGDDGRNVTGVFLQSAEHGGEAGATSRGEPDGSAPASRTARAWACDAAKRAGPPGRAADVVPGSTSG